MNKILNMLRQLFTPRPRKKPYKPISQYVRIHAYTHDGREVYTAWHRNTEDIMDMIQVKKALMLHSEQYPIVNIEYADDWHEPDNGNTPAPFHENPHQPINRSKTSPK